MENGLSSFASPCALVHKREKVFGRSYHKSIGESLVWFPMAIPRQTFVFWLAARDSVATWERMLKRRYKGDVMCAAGVA